MVGGSLSFPSYFQSVTLQYVLNLTPEMPLRCCVSGFSVKMSAFMELKRTEASFSVEHLRSPGELAEHEDSCLYHRDSDSQY